MEERREYYRLVKEVSVAHRVAGSILGGSADTADISAGGLSFPTFQKLDRGMVLNLDITLPGFKKSINAETQVVWQAESKGSNERFLVGTKFIHIEENDRKRIVNFVTSATRSRDAHNQLSHT